VILFCVSEVDKLFDPVLNQSFKSLGENSFKLKVKLRHPDMKIGNISFVEVINNLLNLFEFLAEDVFLD